MLRLLWGVTSKLQDIQRSQGSWGLCFSGCGQPSNNLPWSRDPCSPGLPSVMSGNPAGNTSGTWSSLCFIRRLSNRTISRRHFHSELPFSNLVYWKIPNVSQLLSKDVGRNWKVATSKLREGTVFPCVIWFNYRTHYCRLSLRSGTYQDSETVQNV